MAVSLGMSSQHPTPSTAPSAKAASGGLFALNRSMRVPLVSSGSEESQSKTTMETSMASFQATSSVAQQDDEIVARVGTAAGKVAKIQQEFTMQSQAETEPEVRDALARRARDEAARVIDEQGLSIADYNAVLTAAETDRALEQRLLEAAREVL
nr:DUF4168 domain-containing protein [uncultured Rhodopila sp.]